MENQHQIKLNEQAVEALRSSAKWSLFLAIIGFIGIALMLIAALIMTSIASAIPETASPFAGSMKGFISLFYVAMAVLYFPPTFYLYKYSNEMKTSLLSNDSDMVSTALVHLKSHHKAMGISIIIFISLYILLIFGIVAFFMTKGAAAV